jgi:hypothetical protein
VKRATRASACLLALLATTVAAAADSSDPRVRITRADQTLAAASVLRFSDLGPAWSGGPTKPRSIKIPLCPANQPDDSDLVVTGHAESVLALPSQGLQVDSDALVLKSAAQAERLVARMMRPALPSCLQYDLLRSGVVGTDTKVGRVRKLPIAAAGDHVALYRIGLSVKSGGKFVDVDSDFLFLTNGRMQFFVNLIAPSSIESELAAFEARIAKTLAARGN